MTDGKIAIQLLGQVGISLRVGDIRILVDPYLSNSVAEQEAADLVRLIPVPVRPEDLRDVDYVLITHEHRDHCDLDTLIPIAAASSQCRFMGNAAVRSKLVEGGIAESRLIAAQTDALRLSDELVVYGVPSAHPVVERDGDSAFAAMGYILDVGRYRLYHCGDTAVDEEVIGALAPYAPIDLAFVPVNEHNYYRGQRNILGNMTVREAFSFAEDIGVKKFVPTHWDMFAANQVYPEEITLLYRKIKPNFELVFQPERGELCW